MEKATELLRVKRSIWTELNYRLNWIIFGTLGAVLLMFIPVVGWFLSIGIIVAMLWKVFGFRESELVGTCPACTKQLSVESGRDVFACPVCQSVIRVEEGARLVLVNVS
jgi:predicted RNA-binding Zn-ribbon protein involved in translation (DUF1610 family)